MPCLAPPSVTTVNRSARHLLQLLMTDDLRLHRDNTFLSTRGRENFLDIDLASQLSDPARGD
jgi:hypothetical protein